MLSNCQGIADKIFRNISILNHNLALVSYEQKALRIEERKIPVPHANEVVVTIKTVALSHDDLNHQPNTGDDENNNTGYIPGREACGIVRDVGNGVTHLQKGDHVSLIYFDKTSTNNNGSLCRFKVMDADCCYKVPKEMSFGDGALLVPLAVAVYACKRVGITTGTNLLIWGAETVGLATLLVAKSIGAERIAIADHDEKRLEKATKLGADGVFAIESSDEEKETIQSIKNDFFRDLRVIESPILDQVDLYEIFRFNLDCFEKAVELMTSGKVNASSLVTEKLLFEQSPYVFDIFEDWVNGAEKIMVFC